MKVLPITCTLSACTFFATSSAIFFLSEFSLADFSIFIFKVLYFFNRAFISTIKGPVIPFFPIFMPWISSIVYLLDSNKKEPSHVRVLSKGKFSLQHAKPMPWFSVIFFIFSMVSFLVFSGRYLLPCMNSPFPYSSIHLLANSGNAFFILLKLIGQLQF